MGIPIFYTFFLAFVLQQNSYVQVFACMKAVTDFSDPFLGEDYGCGWLPGFDASRSSSIHTHWVTAVVPMLLVLLLIYFRTGAELVFCSFQHALCYLCSSAKFWLGSGMIFWGGMLTILALALSSLWCHSYFTGRSQLAMAQMLRHPLCSRVCLGEWKLMKSYPQENISKTDGPIRQKHKTGIEEGRTN